MQEFIIWTTGAVVDRWLSPRGSGAGKDAVVSRSLEPVKASENGLYMLANWTGIVSQSAGNVIGAGRLNVGYILSKFSLPFSDVHLCAGVLLSPYFTV